MSYRDLVYSFVNKTAREARQEISRNPKDHQYYQAVEGGSDDDLYLHGLLNGVEEERVHREAEGMRERAKRFAQGGPAGEAMAGALSAHAASMDPYEERDGQVFRKSDGAFIRKVEEKKDDQ